MDWFNFIVGILLLFTGVFIITIQLKGKDYKKESRLTNNIVGFTFAGILGVIGGIYFILESL